MKAIAIEEFGGVDKLKLLELEKPTPVAGEVLLRVKAAGVNPVDYKIRGGLKIGDLPFEFPIVPGWDAAGIVEAVGQDATQFKVGDELFTYCRKPLVKWGSYAEYLAVPESSCCKLPRNATFEEAATIPLAGLTAWQCLFEAGKLRPDDVVLVHAGAGGVGGFAVQLAKYHGAHVIATGLSRNHEFIRRLGADEVIDYSLVDFREMVRGKYPDGIDCVLDLVGGDVFLKSVDVLKEKGRLVSIVKNPDFERAPSSIDFKYVFVRPDQTQLQELARLFERGALRTYLSGVLPLEEAAEAHRRIQTGHTRGKLALKVA